MRSVCAIFEVEMRSTRRICGAFTGRPRKTHSSRYFAFGLTKK